MKILVLGHSDSDGSRLANPRDGFPSLLQRMLAERGIQADAVHRYLYPGPTAAAFVAKQLERQHPDVVVLATTTHSVVVELVSNRVRERWGERAGRLAERAERAVARRADRLPPRATAVATRLRRAGRRLVGTRPALTEQGLIQSYEDCMMALAQAENVHTIIGGGIGYIGEIQRLNPGIDARQAKLQAKFRAAAEAHHFDWLSHEAVLGGPGTKDKYYQPDGIHTDERSHRLFAEALLPLVLARA